jgi:hypothetical protein
MPTRDAITLELTVGTGSYSEIDNLDLPIRLDHSCLKGSRVLDPIPLCLALALGNDSFNERSHLLASL